MSENTSTTRRRGGRRIWKILGVIGGFALALVVLAVVLAPAIASRFAPGIVRGAAKESISGDVSVDRIALSWRGPQRVSGLRLTGPDGDAVADVSVESTVSLIGLLRGSRDLGAITISGEVVIEKGKDGETTLARAVERPTPPAGAPTPTKPAPTPTGGPSRLPPSLAGKLLLDGLTVTYRDAAGGAGSDVRMPGIQGEASFRVGAPIKVALHGAGTVDGRPTSLKLDATIVDWSEPDGRATPEAAKLDATFDLAAPGALIGALASFPGAPPELIAVAEEWSGTGASMATMHLTAKGDSERLVVDLQGALPGAQADVGLILSDLAGGNGFITTSRPASLRATVSPRLVARVAPGTGASLSAPVTVDATLDVTAPIPTGGSLDLRMAAISAGLRVSEIAGTVQVEGEPGPRAVRVAPTTIRIDSSSLEQGASVNAQTSAQVDGQNAGSLNIDLTGEGLLDAAGAPRAPRALRGDVQLTGLATTLAQPFVASAGLDLAKDLGPTLDLTLAAKTAGEAPAGAQLADLPPTDLALTVRSSNLRVDGGLRLEGERVIAGPQGIRALIADAAPLLRRTLADNARLLAGDAPVSLAAQITSLEATLPAPGKRFDPRALTADAQAVVQGLALQVEGERLSLSAIEMAAVAAPGQSPSASVRTSATHQQGTITIEGESALEGLFAPDGRINVAGVRPIGTLVVRDVPVDLARIAGLADMLDLIRAGVGDRVSLTARSTPAPSGDATIDVELAGANAKVAARATLRADSIEFAGGEATTQVTPSLVAQAVRQFAPTMTRPPRLDAPVGVRATIGPARIPMRDGKPDLANAGNIDANVALSGPLVLRGLDAGEGRSVDVALDGVRASARAPISGAGRIDASINAGLFDPARGAGSPVGSLEGQATLAGAGDARTVQGVLRVDRLETTYVDALLGKPGFLSLAVGETADLKAEARPDSSGATALTGTVQAPRLKAQFAATLQPDRVALTAPMTASWTPSEQWMLRYALAGDASAVTILGDTPIDLRVERAAIGLNGRPLKPGVFELAARADIRGLAIATADGQRVRVESAQATLASPSPGALSVDAALRGVRGAAGEPGDATLRATLSNLADGAGVLTPDRAVVNATIDGSIPTALADALARRDGLLLEALGPTTTLNAKADGLSRTGGSVRAKAVTPRAEANVAGDLRDGVFHSTAPVTATIHEITPELSRRMMEAILPLLTRMEKRAADGPAVATVTGLTLPMQAEIDSNGDGVLDAVDLRKLNADVRVELGRMSYATNDLFGRVLKATKNRSEGQLFNRFPPLEVRIRDGVAQYDRTAIPLGEFTVESRGKVDLAARQMDLIIYVPLVGLADEFMGVFRAAPGFNDAAPVPFRMKGPIGKAVPVPAPDLMLKDAVKAPGKIIEEVGKGLEDLFKKR